MRLKNLLMTTSVAVLTLTGFAQAETTLTIATVNNPDMVVMQKYSAEYEAESGVKLNWLVLDENTLRQRVTTDIATGGGQFDIITIGLYETPIWGKQGWLVPFENFSAEYDADDILPTVRDALSYEGKMYSVPFYAESAMTFYRKDLVEAAGLTMPIVGEGHGESEPVTTACVGQQATKALVACLQPDRRVAVELIGSVVQNAVSSAP